GLAIAALAEAGLALDEPGFTAAARDAARLLATVHVADGRLARTSRDGVAGASPGVLEDYGDVAEGFIALSGVTGEAQWTDLAGQLLEIALDHFAEGAGGGTEGGSGGDAGGGAVFYDTADDSESLLYRPADPADGPSPSGTFAIAGALLSYAALTGSTRHRRAALAALATVPALARRFPRAAGWGLAVAEAILAGPAEVAVVGPADDPRTAELHRTALLAAPPGMVLALGDPAVTAGGGPGIPLLTGRGLVGGAPAAYVCRAFTCRAPVTSPERLRAELGSAGPA
ncbi:MAG: N-acylglucosamine 2-epimerase, partial [Streptosporangiaceae bacterium]